MANPLALPLPVQRDQNGEWQHPQLPEWTEQTPPDDITAWCAQQGITSVVLIDLFDQLAGLPAKQATDLLSDYYDKGHRLHRLALMQPEGAGWFLLSVHASSTGPVALWATREPAHPPIETMQSLGRGAPPLTSGHRVTVRVDSLSGTIIGLDNQHPGCYLVELDSPLSVPFAGATPLEE